MTTPPVDRFVNKRIDDNVNRNISTENRSFEKEPKKKLFKFNCIPVFYFRRRSRMVDVAAASTNRITGVWRFTNCHNAEEKRIDRRWH